MTKEQIEKAIEYIKGGGSLRIFAPKDIDEIQNYAIEIKDVRLYDYLSKFWNMV